VECSALPIVDRNNRSGGTPGTGKAIEVTTANVIIQDLDVRGGEDAIGLSGSASSITIRRSEIAKYSLYGIRSYAGNNHTMVDNLLDFDTDAGQIGACTQADKDAGNRYCCDSGEVSEGDIRSCDLIRITTGTGHTINANTLQDSSHGAIQVNGDSSNIYDNFCEDTQGNMDFCVEVNGDSNTVYQNRCKDVSTCAYIGGGDGNELINNIAYGKDATYTYPSEAHFLIDPVSSSISNSKVVGNISYDHDKTAGGDYSSAYYIVNTRSP
jgi:hypothetical protein